MSTRSNVIIKMIGEPDIQLYHHSDGYPEGVGQDLANMFTDEGHKIKEENWKNPEQLGKYIEDYDPSFEYEGENCSPHGDIEYLYTIDIDKQEITCENTYGSKTVYSSSMWDKWKDIKVDED